MAAFKIFLSFIGGVKGLAIILIVIALGGWAYNLKQDVVKANLARDQAIAQRDMAGVERDKAIAAAQTNNETIKRLEQDKKDINLALNTLASAREANRENTITREVIIQNQASVPANAAQVAPVVGEIITAVQNDRIRRRAQ